MQILRLHRKPGGHPLYAMVSLIGGLEQVVDRLGEPAGALVYLGGYPVLVEEQAPDIVDAIAPGPHEGDEVRITRVVQS